MNKCILVVVGLFLVIQVFAGGPCDLINGCIYDGECYTKGQEFNHDRFCYHITCNGNNDTSLMSCAIPSVTGDCVIINHNPGSYPECCPKVICKNKNN